MLLLAVGSYAGAFAIRQPQISPLVQGIKGLSEVPMPNLAQPLARGCMPVLPVAPLSPQVLIKGDGLFSGYYKDEVSS